MMLKKELETAIDLARRAGKRILEYYDTGFITKEKIGADSFPEPVTIADLAASELIVAGLRKEFPNDGILSEELPDTEERLSKQRVWIIDPLDGTKGFIEGNGDFAVQIGLSAQGRCVLGVVFLPFYDSLYYASQNWGSFLSVGDKKTKKLRCSGKTAFSEMILAVSRHHPSPKMARIVNEIGFPNAVRRGSVGLKVGLIATKCCDLYMHFSPRTKHWDTCAPEIIINEAGGRMTDLFGKPFVYNTRDVQNHDGVLATCGGDAHKLTVDRLRPFLDEFGRTRKGNK